MPVNSQTPSNRETGAEIGLLGVGLLGSAICHRLMNYGYQMRVWSRFRHEAEPVMARGAVWSDNPLADCQRVIICLYSSPVVSDVLRSLEAGLHAGQTLIDMTTGSPEDAVQLYQALADRNVFYLEAPVSGSSQQALEGQAMIMVGGDRQAYEVNSDLWNVLGRSVHYTGSSGSASRMKLVTNLVLGLNRAALAEGLSFARAIGVDPQSALQILADSAAASRVLDTKGIKMVEEEFSVQARLSQHLKDVCLMLQVARNSNLQLPLSETHRQLLESAVDRGWGELDNSAIIRVYSNHTQGMKG